MRDALILTINPGATTTRLGLFRPKNGEVEPLVEQTLSHDEAVMATFPTIASQRGFRTNAVREFLQKAVPPGMTLAAVVGRGGMLSPVAAGVIEVDDALVHMALNEPVHHHASNLGAPIASALAKTAGCRAFIVDPVSVDEFPPVARVSGCPDIPRFSFVHALNIRACGRELAARLGKPFAQLNAVVAHLGAGISVAAIKDGRIVDNTNRLESSPFSPERAGGLPPLALIDLCYSGRYSQTELKSRLYGNGGVFAYLGTKDMRKVEAMIDAGDAAARLVWEGMIYQIAKAIGAMATVLDCRPDGIVVTGGMAQSARVTAALEQKVCALASLTLMPGSRESRALAEGAARVLAGVEPARTWPHPPCVEPMPW